MTTLTDNETMTLAELDTKVRAALEALDTTSRMASRICSASTSATGSSRPSKPASGTIPPRSWARTSAP